MGDSVLENGVFERRCGRGCGRGCGEDIKVGFVGFINFYLMSEDGDQSRFLA